MPVGFIAGLGDPVIGTFPMELTTTLSDFRGATMIPATGHWAQQESPAATNAA